MATVTKDLGPVTAYKYAVSKGYTGTEEEFAQLMADLANMSARVDEVEDDVEQVGGSVVYMGERVTTLEGNTAGITRDGNTTNISGHLNTTYDIIAGTTAITGGASARVYVRTQNVNSAIIASNETGRQGLWNYNTNHWVWSAEQDDVLWARTAASTSERGGPLVNGSTVNANMVGWFTSRSNGLSVTGRWGTTDASFSERTISLSGSDSRLKENIKPAEKSGLDLINRLKVKQFDWKDGHGHWDFGVIAQEVQEIDENLVIGEEKEDSYLGIDTLYLCDILVKAVQELSAKVEELEQIVNA